jgi:hypothetical protein
MCSDGLYVHTTGKVASDQGCYRAPCERGTDHTVFATWTDNVLRPQLDAYHDVSEQLDCSALENGSFWR